MKNPHVDTYIAKAQPFAQPILKHLRRLVHKACPEVTETIKWGAPFFDYNGPLSMMASFRAHVAFGFWKEKLLNDPKGYLKNKTAKGSAGNIGKLTSLKDLPSDKVVIKFIKQAKKLNDDGVQVSKRRAPSDKKLVVPDYFMKALKKNPKAVKNFEGFTPGKKRGYLEWITEAKTEETRQRRIDTAVPWIAEGKIRNWKYAK